MNNMDAIKNNINYLRERIAIAAAKSGRKPEDITLVAVSKMADSEDVIAAMKAGQFAFGENRVQELLKKYNEINEKLVAIGDGESEKLPPPEWHLIGHLQKNKVKYIIDKVKLIHSVDSIELAEVIEKRAKKENKIVSFLLQVNVSGEKSKFGVSPEEVFDFVTKMSNFSNVRLEGLMTMAPYVTNPEYARPVFKKLKRLYLDNYVKEFHNVSMKYLSMGMSNDFEIAIEEGANIVRIGSSIFHKG